MTEPYEDPEHIDKCIYACIQRSKQLRNDYREALREATEAEVEYNIAYASRRIEIRNDPPPEIKITEGSLEDLALADTEDLYRDYRLKKAKADAMKAAMGQVRGELDGFRSLAANHREL